MASIYTAIVEGDEHLQNKSVHKLLSAWRIAPEDL